MTRHKQCSNGPRTSLPLPNFQQEFVIESDASGQGIGAILIQNGQPIAYFSKALGERNLVKSA